jgi:NAD(P)-dependent dehydrogenase (short-subunit alcohol dehydrogenase family)
VRGDSGDILWVHGASPRGYLNTFLLLSKIIELLFALIYLSTNEMVVSDKFYAIVAGVGPGTGRSVAIRFSEAYPVVLLARSPDSYNSVVAEINRGGRKAIGITADATDESALKSAFETIKKELPDFKLAAAIYNVRPDSRASRKPFLELTPEDLDISLKGNMYVTINVMPV